MAAVAAAAIATGRRRHAQAILLQDHEQLGERGTVVDVSKGYLRNYLIPRKLAQPATKGAIVAAEKRRERRRQARSPTATAAAQETAALLSRPS